MPFVYILFVFGLFVLRSCTTPIAGYLLGWGCAVVAIIVSLFLRERWGRL